MKIMDNRILVSHHGEGSNERNDGRYCIDFAMCSNDGILYSYKFTLTLTLTLIIVY